MNIWKKFIRCFLVSLFAFVFLNSQNLFSQDFSEKKSAPVENNLNSEKYILADALNAFSKRDWKTSIFLFKKFHLNPSNITQDSLYMLILAETFNGQSKDAIADCDFFIEKFPKSEYIQFVKYQKGRSYFDIFDYEKSILILSDFCNLYPTHQLYSHALFLIAENFYFSYNFDNSKPIYQRIVSEFPDSIKAKDAQYRLDVLAQRSREEKLLYLLKQTGEDFLSSREAFEKVLKQHKIENSVDINSQLKELRDQNDALDKELARERARAAELESMLNIFDDDHVKKVQLLKLQAEGIYKIIQAE